MVANDIVDINEAKCSSDWQRPGFIEKLFTRKEQTYIQGSDNPFIMVWRLWSMKEAAYKLYTQINPSRFYNPRGFECTISGKGGYVRFKDFKCCIQTDIQSDYLLSEAKLQAGEISSRIVLLEGANYQEECSFLKGQALQFLASVKGGKKGNFKFKKNEFGVPKLFDGEKGISVSLTHHGKFGAFAIA